MCARRRSHLSLLRQRNVTQRKASRSRRPCAALRLRCVARSERGPARTRCAQTVAGPDPPSPALLADTTRRGCGSGHPTPARLRRARALGAMWRCAPPIPIPGVPLCMRRGAQRQVDQGWRCLSAASLARPHLQRAPQVSVAPAEDADSGGGLSFGDFSLATQRKVTAPPGAHPGQRRRQHEHFKGQEPPQSCKASPAYSGQSL